MIAPGGPRSLLDLLGARWTLGAPVTAVAWDASAGVAAAGLGDGTVAFARAAWEGAPSLGERPGGGLELVPATAPPPPLARAGAHEGACLAFAAEPDGGFLSGGDDGRLVYLDASGDTLTLERIAGGWVDQVAAGPGGARAFAVRRTVRRLGPGAGELALPSSVSALAFDPSGGLLAIGHHNGVTLWAGGDRPPRLLAWRGLHRALAWSPDGRYLASGMQENALHGWRVADGGDIEMAGYPGQPRSLAFSGDGRFLATSGAPRVICWRFDPPGRPGGPAECGIASRVPVTRVACHPGRPLVAAGYHNGAVLLCQPGVEDVLFVRGSGGGAISGLAWSAEGAALALGDEAGEFAVIALPDRLFRQQARTAEAEGAR